MSGLVEFLGDSDYERIPEIPEQAEMFGFLCKTSVAVSGHLTS